MVEVMFQSEIVLYRENRHRLDLSLTFRDDIMSDILVVSIQIKYMRYLKPLNANKHC